MPYCVARCGYCDFNTYTSLQMAGAPIGSYPDEVIRELQMARAETGPRRLHTIFFGGGTPSLLPPSDIARIIDAACTLYDTPAEQVAEITLEANPETLTRQRVLDYAAGGVNRMSCGMQSGVEHVLARLDRLHTPGQTRKAVEWAREAGLRISLDLIYGTPGESAEDWHTSLEAATSLAPDHISAYGLTIEEGTAMWRAVRKGEYSLPDSDVLADRYEYADRYLSDHGYHWYEVSNWALEGEASLHNLAYWRTYDWWGIGPGAHSHLAGRRFYNRKHPRVWAGLLAAGQLPIEDYEILDDDARANEAMMVGVRLAEGYVVPDDQKESLGQLVEDGLIDPDQAAAGIVQLTLTGRLLADVVIRHLWR